MLGELAERVGPSITWWLEQPFAFGLFVYRHLQERDRRRDWLARIHRIELGQLIAMAFHEPNKLAQEYRSAIADAGQQVPAEDLLALGRKMAADLDKSGALTDG